MDLCITWSNLRWRPARTSVHLKYRIISCLIVCNSIRINSGILLSGYSPSLPRYSLGTYGSVIEYLGKVGRYLLMHPNRGIKITICCFANSIGLSRGRFPLISDAQMLSKVNVSQGLIWLSILFGNWKSVKSFLTRHASVISRTKNTPYVTWY